MKIFYIIWAVALNNERKKIFRNYEGLLIGMSLFLSLNICTLYIIIDMFANLNVMNILEPFIIFIPNKSIKGLLVFSAFMFAPSLLINYYMVFYKKKYRIIMRKYKFRSGKILLIYFIATIVFFFGVSLINQFL